MKYAALCFAVTASVPLLNAQEWTVDRAHSSVQFAVRHLMVSTVRGQFGKVEGKARFDPAKPQDTFVHAEVDATTIDTREPKRDADLKGADFFDVARHPKIVFRSTKTEPAGPGHLKVSGDLTMRGVTRPVVFDFEDISQPVKDRGLLRIGASGRARIARKDFGITWNRAIETGGVAVSDEVTITVDIQITRPAE
ncbi:MAG: YceI family protein [Acidobacteria bacterium]|nr:YceI family protein [Acidobacteriota bacterium]